MFLPKRNSPKHNKYFNEINKELIIEKRLQEENKRNELKKIQRRFKKEDVLFQNFKQEEKNLAKQKKKQYFEELHEETHKKLIKNLKEKYKNDEFKNYLIIDKRREEEIKEKMKKEYKNDLIYQINDKIKKNSNKIDSNKDDFSFIQKFDNKNKSFNCNSKCYKNILLDQINENDAKKQEQKKVILIILF